MIQRIGKRAKATGGYVFDLALTSGGRVEVVAGDLLSRDALRAAVLRETGELLPEDLGGRDWSGYVRGLLATPSPAERAVIDARERATAAGIAFMAQYKGRPAPGTPEHAAWLEERRREEIARRDEAFNTATRARNAEHAQRVGAGIPEGPPAA